MADQRVSGNLILIGSLGGTVAFGAQSSGGGFTILLPTSAPQIGQTLAITSVFNGNTATAQWTSFSGVTSVGIIAPPIFTVSGSPITTAATAPIYNPSLTYTTGQVVSVGVFPGTAYIAIASVPLATPPPNATYWAFYATNGNITLSLVNQNANTMFAGPATGSAAAPTFRPLVVADLPSISASNLSNGVTGSGAVVLAGSPALTGIPTAPTATPLTNSTQIATSAYVDAAVLVEKNRATAAEVTKAPLASPTFTGTVQFGSVAFANLGTLSPVAGSLVYCTNAMGPGDGGTTWGSTAASGGNGALLRFTSAGATPASTWIVIG